MCLVLLYLVMLCYVDGLMYLGSLIFLTGNEGSSESGVEGRWWGQTEGTGWRENYGQDII